MSKISPAEVRHIAELAQIGLTAAEVTAFSVELSQIVEFVAQLDSAEVGATKPTDQVTGLVDVWREDKVEPGLSYDDLKLNAPEWQAGQFKVRRVL